LGVDGEMGKRTAKKKEIKNVSTKASERKNQGI
jgi:hypothetical protein